MNQIEELMLNAEGEINRLRSVNEKLLEACKTLKPMAEKYLRHVGLSPVFDDDIQKAEAAIAAARKESGMQTGDAASDKK